MMTILWSSYGFGDCDVVSWARDGCGLSSARSKSGRDFSFDGVFLVHIMIRASP